jgi:hypothetical protein
LNQKKRELENRRQDIVEGLLLRSQVNLAWEWRKLLWIFL